MLTFFREGGFPMFAILALGLSALGTAMRAAMRPSRARLELARGLARATLYSSLVGLVAALGAVFHNVAAYSTEHNVDLRYAILQGLGEAMSPVIMGFTILSLASLFTAIGARREALEA